MKKNPLACALLLASFAAGCSGAPTTLSSACAGYFDALANLESRCGGKLALSPFAPMYRSTFVTVCDNLVTANGSNVTVTYLNRCASATHAASCDTLDDLSACQTPPGTLADGTACQSEAQCSGGACTPSATTTGTMICGVCSSLAAAGQPCGQATTTNLACAHGLDCLSDNGTDPPTCLATSVIPVGGACASGVTPGSHCATGATCASASSGANANVCTRLPTQGEPCLDGAACHSGLTCVSAVCTARVGVGGACTTGSECQPQLFCDSNTQKCANYTVAQATASCSGEGIECAAGLYCLSTTRVCTPFSQAGGSCSGLQCAPFLACVNTVCVVPDPAQCV